jgi:YbbR domain-containing protein
MNQQVGNRPEPARRGRTALWRELARNLWRLLSRNTPLKLFSLFLAVLLWSVLIASDASLTREKILAAAEVSVSGQEALKARGLIVMDDISGLLPTVRLRVDVPQGAYDRVTAGNYAPRIDLSRVRQAGVQDLPVTMTSTSYGQVLEVEPSHVTVTVEQYSIRGRIPMEVETVGQLAPGLWADTPKVDPMLVSVSGPLPMVEKVARVTAQLDLSALTGERPTERSALRFMPEDADGNDLDSPLIQVSSNDGVILESVLVEVSCYPQRDVPVDLLSAVEGAPAEGYELTSVTAEPGQVAVSASQTVLDQLSRVFVDAPL